MIQMRMGVAFGALSLSLYICIYIYILYHTHVCNYVMSCCVMLHYLTVCYVISCTETEFSLSNPHLTAYTDGSCPNNRTVSYSNPAGWGFCLTSNHQQWTDGYGLLCTNPDMPQHGGAEVGSNNTAELQALVELFDYLLRITPSLPIMIYTDSQYALDVLHEILVPTTHLTLVYNLQTYWKHLMRTHSVQVQKIAGHAGIEGNERADSNANLGATGRI